MVEESPGDDRKLTDDEREAERRFHDTLGRLVNTPHKPHKPKRPTPNKA
jgi:hypothetical protein